MGYFCPLSCGLVFHHLSLLCFIFVKGGFRCWFPPFETQKVAVVAGVYGSSWRLLEELLVGLKKQPPRAGNLGFSFSGSNMSFRLDRYKMTDENLLMSGGGKI